MAEFIAESVHNMDFVGNYISETSEKIITISGLFRRFGFPTLIINLKEN